ncbi:MAG: protein phosphatase 2C domain-containing protein [Acidobacteria bacterium]|nr:protein phosphatase 2C domain-containing protein [Acidobacteriota bacterium]
MTEHSNGIRVETASVTDRGLNERRPLNEDSMLTDPEHNVYVVADGVGGAEAGEVASQTAIEVLGEAFRHHNTGEDVEDLMEIAIQRANDSIYRMSREHPKFSMMATTIVALQVDGLRATIGHVGDSRLYSLRPDGSLRRETEDHSVVEEEVRAGRMTAEQAANHPSRNVISRALGAEASVEVDMKTIEVESGTTFLICSDGITRHIPDEELSTVLRAAPNLEAACAEMKRLCFERGAEDNLTAVLVRVGEGGEEGRAAPTNADADEEPTLLQERVSPALARTLSDSEPVMAGSILQRPFHDAGTAARGEAASAPFDGGGGTSSVPHDSSKQSPANARRGGGAGRVFGVLLLVLAAAAAAFYGGMMFQRREAESRPPLAATAAAIPTPEVESPEEKFERMKRAVDLSPAAEAARMSVATGTTATLDSADPEFLYLYGRALLLTGKSEDAAAAFERAVQRAAENMTPRNGQLKIDARLAATAARLRSEDFNGAREAARALDEFMRPGTPAAEGNTPAAPSVSP